MVMPRMLSLSAVQRQNATSRSIRSESIEQQGLMASAPIFRLIMLRTLAHVDNLKESTGQFSAKIGITRLRKRRLITRNKESVVEVFEAIVDPDLVFLIFLYVIGVCITLIYEAFKYMKGD